MNTKTLDKKTLGKLSDMQLDVLYLRIVLNHRIDFETIPKFSKCFSRAYVIKQITNKLKNDNDKRH